LHRLGAVTPKAGVYVLPAQDDCVEAFQWLAQEVQEMGGEAVVMRVDRFEGLPDTKLQGLFQQACRDKYAEIEKAATELEQVLRSRKSSLDRAESLGRLEKLRKRHIEIAEIDFFNAPEGVKVGALLRSLDERLRPRDTIVASVAPMNISDYRQVRWVTRPRPHVDRLACAWLIRRFVNPSAEIRYGIRPEPGEVGFDMRDAVFGHRGNLCTFETMVSAFDLKEPGLQGIAEIVHEIDLRDGRYGRPETAGIALVLKGWLTEKLSDAEIEHRGIALFEGLFSALSRSSRSEKPK
jgi:hypothetical protein